MTRTENAAGESSDPRLDLWVLTSPHWLTLFVALSVVISFVPFFVGFALGLSVASDVVFGFYAMISGICADLIVRRAMKRRLLIWKTPPISFVYFWVILCLYVMVMKPFGG
jgi:hypothetical protein